MIDAQVPAAVRTRLLDPRRVRSAKLVPPGFSGATVLDCRDDGGGRFALKAWPSGTTAKRVGEVHRVQTIARESGCEAVPKIHGVILVRDRVWELSSWMPGEPVPADASVRIISSGADQIRKFHRCVARMGGIDQPSPAILARLSRLDELATWVPTMLGLVQEPRFADRYHADLSVAIRNASDLIRQDWTFVADRIATDLAIFGHRSTPTQYVLRDCHREHVLFLDGEPSGLIDFDAVRIDTPATDLARWVGGFLVGDDPRRDDAVWEAAMAGFDEKNVLESRAIHFSTTWISLANWLVWIVIEKRSFPSGPLAVAARIEHLSQLARRLSPTVR